MVGHRLGQRCPPLGRVEGVGKVLGLMGDEPARDWAAHPRMCCAGTPAYMHAVTGAPPGRSGFTRLPVTGLELWFRVPAGPLPDVLEIGLRGKRRPRVEAYWDGCLFALGA